MKKFLYRAKGANDRIVSGSVNAENEAAAETILVKNNLVALEIIPAQAPSVFSFGRLFNKVTGKDKALFARQLATMIQAGLTLPKAIKIASTQTRNDYVRNVYLDVYKDLSEGAQFSAALAKHPQAFDRVFVSVVGAGESTGKLDVVLAQLASQLENDNNFAGKVKGAMYYPAFILVALILIGAYMLVKVVPTLKGIFDAQGAALPWSTRMLMSTSDFMQAYWYIVLAIVVAAAVFMRYYITSDAGGTLKDNIELGIPGLNKIFKGMYMYRMTQVLAMLLGAGVPMLTSLKICASAVGNGVYEDAMLDVAKHVERGVPLSSQLLKEPIFPQIIGQMASVGEETGQLDEVMEKVSQYYKEETDQLVKTLSTLIEPIILVIMGIGVAFLVFSVLVPIYQISSLAS